MPTIKVKKMQKDIKSIRLDRMFFNNSVWPVYVMLLVTVLLITGLVNDWSLSEQFMNFLTSE